MKYYIFITAVVSLIFLLIFAYAYFYLFLPLNWPLSWFILAAVLIIIYYFLGYVYYTSSSPKQSIVKGWILLFYFLCFVLSMYYIFAPGIVAPWPYEITVKEVLFRSYISGIATLFNAALYDTLLRIKIIKKYDARKQVILQMVLLIAAVIILFIL